MKPSKKAQEAYAANRKATLEKAKTHLRKRVAKGYYPVSQVSGKPSVAVGEPI